MKTILAVLSAFVLSQNAYADGSDFQETTDKALAAGSPAAVLKALDREIYRGNLIAAEQLGLMYRDGKKVPQDFAKARKFLKIAATSNITRIWYRRGVSAAQYALAVMLQAGIGGKADPSGAESWFVEAAEQGDGRAQLALAQMYFKGAGIKRNLERAFLWSSLAASSLTDAAQKEADQIRNQSQSQLQPKQLEKAKKLVSIWKPKTS